MSDEIAEITETPVTGMHGRTPRDLIEKPKTGTRKIEVAEIIDVSGSNQEPVAPGSAMTKQQLIINTQPMLVKALEGDDAEAATEQADGSSDKGGVRVWYANEPEPIVFEAGEDESDDERDGGDHNTANVLDRVKSIPWGGRTYLMPAINAAEHAYLAEFPNDPNRALEILVVTDGKVSDPREFEQWLATANEGKVIAVAVIGSGRGHDEAVGHYQRLAAENRYLTYVALTGVTDPNEVAFDLRLLSGTASASS